MHKLKPYVIEGGGGGRDRESCHRVIFGGLWPVREREMGGGGSDRQTEQRWCVCVCVCGGGGGQTARKREWIDKRQRVGHRETKRETDEHTTEKACINIHTTRIKHCHKHHGRSL